MGSPEDMATNLQCHLQELIHISIAIFQLLAITLWNKLSNETVNASSINGFANLLTQ